MAHQAVLPLFTAYKAVDNAVDNKVRIKVYKLS